ncbi:outer membrane beta-barrel protein [Flavobacterium sp. Sd200]|uniref:outer membrane beta-barrel protein n=1 Tax=Flavobacterium sp. Sd200 TaxID=2692211 RepID=UPI00136A18CB|nr:outer membrane beta-barrel protein [Flavobacterium sp. Sd200]MXN91090.1 outer membrane beta-barrel protein [Flavobacterium sp. Sd200]
MQKIFTLLLVAFTSALGFSQNITLKGKVTDPDNFPLESATVYLSTVKDSAMVAYSVTNKDGSWEIRTRVTKDPVFLKVSYMGFADFKQKLTTLVANMDFGVQKLSDKATTLNEVIIVSEAPPVRVKKDTLEFNAGSFKVRPDANVEALLKQLPGVDVDSDGVITINGKQVDQILVNRKPFFDRDGKIALKNLPASLINKVQVSDTKTKEEELLNRRASGNNSSINFTIDEKKNKGLFGKIMGGYGTDDRYETSGMLNYFEGKKRISLLASSNNINSTGFSMDEIFDSMGGGRNVSSGVFGAVRQAGNGIGQGITQSNMAGGSYNDEWFKNFSSTLNYFYNSADTENNNRTRETTFLPATSGDTTQKSQTETSTSSTDNSRYVHNAGSEFEWKLNKQTTIFMDPRFVTGNSKERNVTSRETVDQDGNLINRSDNNTFNDTDNRSFTNRLQIRRAFDKKGRAISAGFNNNNSVDDTQNLNRQSIDFGDGSSTNVDQLKQTTTTNDNYSGSLEYLEPITDSLRIKVKGAYSSSQNTRNREGFDYDAASGQYSAFNDLLTNYLSSTTGSFIPTAGFELDKNKYDLSTELGQRIISFDNHSVYLGDYYSLNKNYILPFANVQAGITFSQSKRLRFNYNYDTSLPTATQILPVEDVSNPLNTIVGNPDLDPNKSHNININFRNFDFATRSGYNLYGNARFYDSQVASFTEIDVTDGTRITSYQNVSGAYNLSVGGNYNKSIKRGAHTFRYNLGLNSSYNLTKGFTNAQQYEARSLTLSPRLNFSYDYGELLTINPSYSYTYNQSDYTNYRITQASNYVHRINLATTSYWPKNVVFGNDFGYTYNSIDTGFRKDFYLWNTSLGYSFLDNHFMFKIKVYDVLNQNLGITRSITATSIEDQENTVLKRYAMFSLTYSLKQFGGKRVPGGDRPPGGGGNFRGRRM